MHLQIKVKPRTGTWVSSNAFLDQVLSAIKLGGYSLAGIDVNASDEEVRIVPVGADDPDAAAIHHEIIDEVIAHLNKEEFGLAASPADGDIRFVPHIPGGLRDLLREYDYATVESVLVMAAPDKPDVRVSIGLDQPARPRP